MFWEFCEDEIPIEKQKVLIRRVCHECGKPPEHAVGDRAVKDMCAWVMHAFPQTWFHRMKTRQEQSVNIGLEYLRNWIDPLEGAPRFYVADHIAESDNPRGIARALSDYRWKENRQGLITDIPRKDDISDHAVDAARMYCRALTRSDTSAPFVVSKGHASKFEQRNRSRRY